MTVVLERTGREVNWLKAVDPAAMCRWDRRSIYGDNVRGSLRTIAHFESLDQKAQRRFGVHFEVIQPPYNSDVPASAGTHDYDCCVDWYLPGVDWWTAQRWGRANGLGGWFRYPPMFGYHLHGFTLPALQKDGSLSWSFATRVGEWVPGQLYDYYKHAFGLSGMHDPGSDRSWYPRDIRSTVFNLRRFVQLKREEHMEYKDWSAESKKQLASDVAQALLNAQLNTQDAPKGDARFQDKTVRWALKESTLR